MYKSYLEKWVNRQEKPRKALIKLANIYKSVKTHKSNALQSTNYENPLDFIYAKKYKFIKP